jgi:hypothetical protein
MSQELTGAGSAGGTGGNYLGTFTEVTHLGTDTGVQFDIPTGYIRYEIHIQNALNQSAADRTLELYFGSVATPNVFGAVNIESVAGSGNYVSNGAVLNLDSEGTREAAANNRAYIHVNEAGRGMGIDATEEYNGIITVVNPGSASDYCMFYWQASHTAGDGNHQYVYGSAVREETSPINECLIRCNTNEDMEIRCDLYGWLDLS